MPFTPATGPRLLVDHMFAGETARQVLAAGLKTLTEQLGVSSLHVTFATEADVDVLQQTGFLLRTDQQFHFRNEDYGTYDDFLSTLASRKRKALKKERSIQKILKQAISGDSADLKKVERSLRRLIK